jgi:tRNA U34 2-thiouridine synthase MnmA/TrmU
MTKAIVLFSGGLDSILAAELIRRQNIELLGLTFTTPFFDAQKAKSAIEQIHLPLEIMDITEEHLNMLKSPRYGYGRHMNPCIDCHTLMLKIAGKQMEKTRSDFIITGEVLGQRPMSQNKQSLHIIAKHSGYADFILRPLSAHLLEPIRAEKENIVDRSRLMAIQGRGRKAQMKLAAEFGISRYAPPAGGCLLTDAMFTRRLTDLFSHQPEHSIRDIEMLKYGRHFRIHDRCKIIVGRNSRDNEALKKLSEPEDMIFYVKKFPGPIVLARCENPSCIAIAASLCILYSDAPKDSDVEVICRKDNTTKLITAKADSQEDCSRWMI